MKQLYKKTTRQAVQSKKVKQKVKHNQKDPFGAAWGLHVEKYRGENMALLSANETIIWLAKCIAQTVLKSCHIKIKT